MQIKGSKNASEKPLVPTGNGERMEEFLLLTVTVWQRWTGDLSRSILLWATAAGVEGRDSLYISYTTYWVMPLAIKTVP